MIIEIVILVFFIGIWLSINELPIILGSTVSSGIIRPVYIPVIIIIAFSPAFLFSSDIVLNIKEVADMNNQFTVMILGFSAAISIFIISFFTKWTSVLYSVAGGLFALKIYSTDNSSLSFFWKSSIAWLVAPVLAFVFSAALFIFIKFVVKKAGLHLMTLNQILRILLIASLILILFSFAVNNGSLLLALTSGIDSLLTINIAGDSMHGDFLVWVLFLLLVLILFIYPVRSMANKMSNKLFDNNTETSIVIMSSMSIVMLIFSSNTICSLFGLIATPVSPIHIALGSFIGIGWIQNGIALDKRELIKSSLSVVILPVLSFFLTYLIFSIIDLRKNLTDNSILYKGELSFDMTTFAVIAVLVLLSVFVLYSYITKSRASEHEKLKIAEDRNHMNEMQKALVDLEIKVIQSENNSLHKRLEIKRKDLINNALWIGQQRDFLDKLSSDIHILRRAETIDEVRNQILSIEGKIMEKKAFSHEMNELYSQVETLHKDYSVILHEKFPDLTEQEKRLATLLRLGFSTKELASIMSITPKSVEVCRYRLRKRLNLKRDENLIQFIKSL